MDIDVVPNSLTGVARGRVQTVIHKVGGQLIAISHQIVISDNNNNNLPIGTQCQIRAFRASTHKHAQYSDPELL